MTNVAFSTYAFAATGGTATRTSPARAADIINVKEFGATGNGVTDDTTAFTNWINFLQSVTAQPLSGFMPAGKYLITAPLPRITHPIGIYGAGVFRTWIVLDPGMAGDLFSFSECWRGAGTSWPNLGPTAITATSTTGLTIRDFTVLGSRAAAAGSQNCFVFYNRNDDVRMDNVDCYYVNGRGIYVGVRDGVSQAYMRESRFTNCKVMWCGATSTIPAVEFTSQATSAGSDGTNEIVIEGLEIYSPYGPGLWIRNEGPTSGTTRSFYISKLRVEGNSNATPVATSDLVIIGDTTAINNVNSISIVQAEILVSYPTAAAVRITAPVGGTVPYFISFEGNITNGGRADGVALSIDAGRLLFFDLPVLSSLSTSELVVGPSTLIQGPIYLNGYGQEGAWTTSIDATSAYHLISPVSTSGAIDNLNIGQTALGTTQATALAVTATMTEVTTTAVGTGVVLPKSVGGFSCTVANFGVNTLNVYPNVGARIDRLAANAPLTVATNKTVTLTSTSTTQWYGLSAFG